METLNKILFFIVLIAISFGCSKKDENAPDISVDANNNYKWTLQEYYKIPVVFANDDENGDITSDIVFNHDIEFYANIELSSDSTHYVLSNKLTNASEGYVGKAGDYTITYTVSDNAGNTSTRNIVVSIKNSMDYMSMDSIGTNIEYQSKREKIEGLLDIGGIYDIPNNIYQPEYDFSDSITINLYTNSIINNKMSIPNIAEISGLRLDFFADTSINSISFPEQWATGEENDTSLQSYEKTEYLYILRQNGGSEFITDGLYIIYEIERYKRSDSFDYDYEFDGSFWKFDRKATYKETYIAIL
jgi:hypothetical protein